MIKSSSKRLSVNGNSVSSDVYNTVIGGYKVIDLWLKYRKGQTFSYDMSKELEKIVNALEHMKKTQANIDDVIDNFDTL